MTTKTDAPERKSKVTIPSFALESANELAKLRTTYPTAGNFFSGVDVAASESDGKDQLFFLRDFSTPSLLIEQSLKRAKYQVTHVQDADLLIDACTAGRADVVVIDHSLPIKDRLTLVRDIRDKHPSVPIVMVFKPGSENEVLAAQTEVKAECVIRDRDGAYLLKIPDIADKFIRERQDRILTGRPTPDIPREDSTDRVDLSSLAEGVRGAIVNSQKPSPSDRTRTCGRRRRASTLRIAWSGDRGGDRMAWWVAMRRYAISVGHARHQSVPSVRH